ncbi:MAG: ribosome silencing factor [Adlercreutzia sp.]
MTDAVEQQAAFSRECALIAAKAADEKKATDIMVQEVRDLIGVTDYFVIATAANSRQVDAIIDEIEDKLREEASIKPTHREMSADGSWSLLDYGNIVVHVFMP